MQFEMISFVHNTTSVLLLDLILPYVVTFQFASIRVSAWLRNVIVHNSEGLLTRLMVSCDYMDLFHQE